MPRLHYTAHILGPNTSNNAIHVLPPFLLVCTHTHTHTHSRGNRKRDTVKLVTINTHTGHIYIQSPITLLSVMAHKGKLKPVSQQSATDFTLKITGRKKIVKSLLHKKQTFYKKKNFKKKKEESHSCYRFMKICFTSPTASKL